MNLEGILARILQDSTAEQNPPSSRIARSVPPPSFRIDEVASGIHTALYGTAGNKDLSCIMNARWIPDARCARSGMTGGCMLLHLQKLRRFFRWRIEHQSALNYYINVLQYRNIVQGTALHCHQVTQQALFNCTYAVFPTHVSSCH